MRFDAVIFDLDGTITESAEGIMRSAAYALNELGKPVPSQDILRKFVGPPLYTSFRGYCGLSEEEAFEAIRLFQSRHGEIGWKEARVYEGIYELLYSLRKAGVYVALASAKRTVLCEKTLSYFGLRQFFSKICAPDVSGKSADKTENIKAALPENCKNPCMVGDREFDMLGAKGAGLFAMGALYGYGTREELENSGADEICESVSALRQALLGDYPVQRGKFITLEGSDGCGKSTQLRLLKTALEECGISVVTTREPGGCPISESIRQVLLDVKSMGMTDECEALLFAAARAQHIHDTILPALNAGKTVLCDRFVDSSIAYQGAGRQLGNWVEKINERAVNGCKPDMTLIFDISPEEAIARRLKATGADRIEMSDGGFRQRVDAAFRSMCESSKPGYFSVDASGSVEQVAGRVRQIVINQLTSGDENG